ncbi:hypothetical protein I8746_10480 [Pseudomonas sp. USTB-Z]|uniref:hypothetical protein n=1 Tax=Pseudomonas sp. USTB-Z TaxID=2794351 RepID=UPI001C82B401|nr:hypothetical protein [Pseudomonas sp. USTB-Z]MBX6690028.1 hypothetical protein [Pseudomonas sp. USTB-Z]
MPSKSLSLDQERLLWEIALKHFGPELLLKIVVELWGTFDYPEHATVDHLTTATLGHLVLNILKIAQGRVGAFVPLSDAVPDTVTLYSRHASELADGLMARLPMSQLTYRMKGDRIHDELGL